MSRIEPLSPDALSDRQKQVHDAIASGPRGRVRGPLAVWLHRPDLADRAQALGRYCRYDSLLEPRLSELAILAPMPHLKLTGSSQRTKTKSFKTLVPLVKLSGGPMIALAD